MEPATPDPVPQDLIDAGRGYEAMFVPALFAEWPPHLTEGAGIKSGSKVLDIACGTGVLARHALSIVGPEGHVVGADPAPGMLAVARDIEPAIDWVLCSAEDLNLQDAMFDCVMCQFGMMLFQDRQKAIAEMLRVLKPGGTLAIAVWNSVDHNPAYRGVISILQEKVGTDAADALRLPFSLGNANKIVAELESGGFTDVHNDTKAGTARFPSLQVMLEAEIRGWLPLFGISLSEDKIADIIATAHDNLADYVTPSGEAVFPTSAHIITATKPA